MSVIWKYNLPLDIQPQQIEIPIGAVIINVHQQANEPCFWAIVEPENEKELRTFYIKATGEAIEDKLSYLGTCYTHNARYVWHIFESK